MPISIATQQGRSVYVYDDENRQILLIPTGTLPHDGPKGFTSTVISVQRDGTIYTYNDQGHIIGSVIAG